MTPASPNDKNVDVSDVLNDNTPDSEGLNPDTLDADFEQELEDLFADDLEEDVVDSDEGPVVLDDVADDEPILLDDLAEEGEPVDLDIAAAAEPESEDDDLIVLDDIVEEDDDEPLVLDEPVEDEPVESAADVETLLDDIAEEAESEPEAADEIVELDDLVAEVADSDEEVMELDDLLEEEESATAEVEGAETLMAEEPENIEVEDVPDVEALELEAEVVTESEAEAEEIFPEMDDMVDVALAEESAHEVPVDEAVAADELEAIMDEPEPTPQVVEGNVFANKVKTESVAESMDSELTGLDALDEDDIEDVDSLLDNVEVDVSDVVDVESDEDLEIPELDADLSDVLTAEAMPPDAGHEVEDVNVDQLLADVRSDAGEATVAELREKVALLEGRVEDLEKRLREEIANLVPAEAARIIREEIAALASELED